MPKPKKIPSTQMNLSICETPPMTLPQDKQRELAGALADLLWNAAVVSEPSTYATGGDQQ
jgi:hypothetical protein